MLAKKAWITIGLTIAVAMTCAAQAWGARLPTPTEGKALRAAFRADKRHPRNATIVFIRVSTANTRWAQVQWERTPRHGVADVAKEKIINVSDYNLSPRRTKAKPAPQKPPKAVAKDLDNNHFYIDFLWTANGKEDANRTDTIPPPEGETCGETDKFETHQAYSWTQDFEIDMMHPAEQFLTPTSVDGETWFERELKPYLGTDNVWGSFQATTCSGSGGYSCTETLKSKHLGLSELTDLPGYPGLYPFGGSWGSTTSSCSDGRGWGDNHALALRFLGGPLAFLRARLCCGQDTSKLLGPHPVTLAANVGYPGFFDPGPVDSQHTGLCPSDWSAYNTTACSDVLTQYDGTITVTLPPSDFP